MNSKEKGKAYDEALERCKKEFNFNNLAYSHEEIRQRLERVFPELKEYEENKKWIKWLITHLEGYMNTTSDEYREVCKKAIGWLKKQGEQKLQGEPILEVWKDMRLEVYQQASGNRHEPNYSDDSTKMFSLADIDEIFEKVAEKQGNDNCMTKDDKNVWNNAHDFRPKHLQRCLCFDKYMGWAYCYVYDDIDKYWCTQTTEEHDQDGDNHICDYADYRVTMWMPIPSTSSYSSKKQGEQKSADKVEPKFKVGDVMRTLEEAFDGYTDGMPVIVSIDEEYYHCTNELIAIRDQDNYEYPPMYRATAWDEGKGGKE